MYVRVVDEQRDPFCQSGQCWKRFKATSTVDILSRLFPCFSALTLFNMFYWDEKFVLCICASKYAHVCTYAVCVCYTYTRQKVAESEGSVGLKKSQRSKKMGSNYVSFHFAMHLAHHCTRQFCNYKNKD